MGHAMENIVSCQLQTYFALLYGLISLESIMENKPSNKVRKFKQILKWKNGVKVTNYLPLMLAPTSTIFFWVKQLKLSDNPYITSFKHLGYSSVHHIMADLNGFYKFYTQQRFDFYLYKFYFLCDFYLIFIYIFVQISTIN